MSLRSSTRPHIRNSFLCGNIGHRVTISSDDKSECPYRVCRDRSEAPFALCPGDVKVVVQAQANTAGKPRRILEFAGNTLKVVCSDATAFMNFHRVLHTCIHARKGSTSATHFLFEFNGNSVSCDGTAESSSANRKAENEPISAEKATNNLTKKLGRAPTEAEIAACQAKEAEKETKAKSAPEPAPEDNGRFLSELKVGDVVTYTSEFNRSYGKQKSMLLTVTGACVAQGSAGETPWARPKFLDDDLLPRCAQASSEASRDTANWMLCHMRFDLMRQPKDFANDDLMIRRFGAHDMAAKWCGLLRESIVLSSSLRRRGPGKCLRESIVQRMSRDLSGELDFAQASNDKPSGVQIER